MLANLSGFCYWERQRGLSGTLADIVANEIVSAGSARAVVDIAVTDVGFEFGSGCGVLRPYAAVGIQGSFATGYWVVNADLAPGTYRSDAQTSCYWAVLKSFSGLSSDIIANEFTSTVGQQLVTIPATAVGFETNAACGTWTRIS